MKRVAVIIARSVLAVAAFIAVVVKALALADVIEEQPVVEAMAIFVAGGIVLIESIMSIVRNARQPAIEAELKRVEKSSLALLKAVADVTGIDILAVGVSVFIAKRAGVLGWRSVRLERTTRIRLNDHPQPSPVAWVGDKGAIGYAYQRRTQKHVNWVAIAKRYGNVEFTESSYAKVRDDTKFGFTREEFQAIVHKYGEILATPIWSEDQRRCVGVLAIDVPMSVEHANLGTCLNTRQVHEIASSSAAVLSGIIGKK